MYGWGNGGSSQRPAGTADADNPSEATIARRREADLAFLAWVKVATIRELASSLREATGWRRIAVERRMRDVVKR